MKPWLILRATLLVSLFVFYAGIAIAQSPDVLVLARVEIAGALPTLPMYAQLRDAAGRDYALVVVSLARLQASATPYQVLDTHARASDYVIAFTRRADTRARAAQIVTVLHDDGKQIVARVSPAQADALAALGFALQRLDDAPMVLAVPARLAMPSAPMPDATIAAMIAQVQSSTVSDYVRQVSGATPVTIGGAPYTLASRHTNSGEPIQKATQFVYEHLQSRGLTVNYHNWARCGISNRNVVGQKTGLVLPNEIVLITAHLDDMPSGALAPGADDNASGSVGVMIAADILSGSPLQRTVRFVFFTGEEQGLCGAAQYAADVKSLGENIVAVYNLDMIAWDHTNGPTLRLHTRGASNPGYAADLSIANTFVNVVSHYGLSGSLSPIIDSDGDGQSDHAEFWNRGYPGILAIEDDVSDFNPYYHTPNDRVAAINPTYFTNYVRATIGTIAHLADSVAATGILRGTITDAVTHLPIADVFVAASASGAPTNSIRSDARGVYSTTIPAGAYTVSASSARYLFQSTTGVIVAEGGTTTQNFALAPAPAILFLPALLKPGQ